MLPLHPLRIPNTPILLAHNLRHIRTLQQSTSLRNTITMVFALFLILLVFFFFMSISSPEFLMIFLLDAEFCWAFDYCFASLETISLKS